MNRRGWHVFFVSSPLGLSRCIRVRGPVAGMLAALLILGAVGFGRCAYMLFSYSYAKFGVYNEKKRNDDLVKTVRFLERLSEVRAREVADLASYENAARLKYGMNPISEEVRRAGIGGRPSGDEVVINSLEDMAVRKAGRVAAKIEELMRRAILQDTTFSRMAKHVDRQSDRWAQRPSIWPTVGRRVTSSYGYRRHPFLRRVVFHEGIDIADKTWTPVFATADGIVSFVGTKRDFGNLVKVSHRGGEFTTVYAHLVKAARVEGEVVKRGEVIGYIGNSGRSTGPHLHYEVRHFDRHVNPMKFVLPVDTVVD
ncbi:MAG: peptidoglycan DD-metalloendopeptidase family protein [Chitinivibrionales bacterium]|nr:peptidoglycan DD-metalloendopeptidase family protein [Chitinivibrionales bacterium]MBD3355780.1 peptidoglycan DD-metalloendopeptidase family protein [Chitinivibrionales bacterium]